MTLPAIGSASGNLTITQGNTGTLIIDTESSGGGTNQCWQKTNYRGDPLEFGAYGDGTHAAQTTTALQNWLGAYGNVGAGAPGTLPPSFGPWKAAIPGNYVTNAPLVCAQNMTIEGPNNLGGFSGTAPVTISAGSGFSGGTSIFQAYDYCRISGIAIVNAPGLTNVDDVDVLGSHVTIDGFSQMGKGNPYDLKCLIAGGNSVIGLQVKNVELDSAASDDVYIDGSCHDVRLIGDIFSGAGDSDIYFNGGEGTIADGVIEESAGIGLYLNGADRVSVSGMHIQGNGRGDATVTTTGKAGVQIRNSNTVSICGNHLEGNGGFETNSAQVYFTGTSDNINFCGNVYEPETISNVAWGPLYVYDADSGAVLTNAHFFDSPAPQADGVYSSAAAVRHLHRG